MANAQCGHVADCTLVVVTRQVTAASSMDDEFALLPFHGTADAWLQGQDSQRFHDERQQEACQGIVNIGQKVFQALEVPKRGRSKIDARRLVHQRASPRHRLSFGRGGFSPRARTTKYARASSNR